jgi:hypothetical protein
MQIELISKSDLESLEERIVEKISASLSILKNQSKWLRSADVCKLLGICANTLKKYRVEGLLPYSTIGNTIFYNYNDIDKVLLERKKERE